MEIMCSLVEKYLQYNMSQVIINNLLNPQSDDESSATFAPQQRFTFVAPSFTTTETALVPTVNNDIARMDSPSKVSSAEEVMIS